MIKAGFSGFMGNVPFKMMSDKYQRAGFNLTFGDHQRLERLVKNHYQIAAVSANSILLNLDQILDKAKVVYAYVKAIGNGSDLIVCCGEVPNAQQLSRLRIGVQKGSLEHFIFEYLFFTNGIKHETEYSWMPRNVYAENMANGEIDAAVFCDPTLTQILKDSRFQLFAGDMHDVALTAVGVIAVRKEMLFSQQDNVAQFISILRNGIEAMNTADNETLKERAAEFFQGIENPKDTLLSRIAFMTAEENRKLFSTNEAESFFGRWPEWLRFLETSGLIALPTFGLSATDIFNDSIVRIL